MKFPFASTSLWACCVCTPGSHVTGGSFIRNLTYIMTAMGRTFFSNLFTTLDMQFSTGTYFNADFMYYSVSGNREFTYVRRQRQDDGYQYNVINPIAQNK